VLVVRTTIGARAPSDTLEPQHRVLKQGPLGNKRQELLRQKSPRHVPEAAARSARQDYWKKNEELISAGTGRERLILLAARLSPDRYLLESLRRPKIWDRVALLVCVRCPIYLRTCPRRHRYFAGWPRCGSFSGGHSGSCWNYLRRTSPGESRRRDARRTRIHLSGHPHDVITLSSSWCARTTGVSRPAAWWWISERTSARLPCTQGGAAPGPARV